MEAVGMIPSQKNSEKLMFTGLIYFPLAFKITIIE